MDLCGAYISPSYLAIKVGRELRQHWHSGLPCSRMFWQINPGPGRTSVVVVEAGWIELVVASCKEPCQCLKKRRVFFSVDELLSYQFFTRVDLHAYAYFVHSESEIGVGDTELGGWLVGCGYHVGSW